VTINAPAVTPFLCTHVQRTRKGRASHLLTVHEARTQNSYQTEQVIQFTFFQSNGKALFVNPLTEIKLAENTSAKIIFNYVSRGGSGNVVNSHAQIQLSRAAHLQFLQIQNEVLVDTHVSRVIFDLSDQAQLTTLDLSLGGVLARHYVQVNFNGEQAHAGVYGVIALAGHQHSDQYTFINHIKGLNNSIQKYKSILADQSNSIFRGRVRIEQDAQKANSEQLNNSLMLSREANVSSIPQLEIYADDVKAGHGSTVGQLNKEEMFYFLSRGIDQITATKMLAYGFVMEMSSVFESKPLQDKVSTILNEKLNGMFK
jgi:Fe-S cluster assembly protein SufD